MTLPDKPTEAPKDVLMRYNTNSSIKISLDMEEEVKPTSVETEDKLTAVGPRTT